MCKQMCHSCIHDCKGESIPSICENFILAPTPEDYLEILHELNSNIKRICEENGLNSGILFKMLKGRQNFIYKYHRVLIENLYERQEYLQYVLEGNDGEE